MFVKFVCIPQAVVDYTNLSSSWYMPARYYTKRQEIGGTGQFISFIFLDTNPCVADYRSADPAYWDPCSTTYPTCSPTGTDDDFEGPCVFNANILEQDCAAQYDWFLQVGAPRVRRLGG